MEVVVGLLVFVGLAVFFHRLGRYSDESEPPKHHSAKRPNPKKTTRISSAGYTTPSPARFDAKSSGHLPEAKVIEGAAFVTDGDTITVSGTQIRLFGVDAPELDHPYGKKAKWALVRLCKGHKIRASVSEQDAYGRTVARCTLPDGRDLSAEMVKLGLALDWPKFSGGIYKNMETPDARKKLWLAAARQKGHMHVWKKFDAQKSARRT